MKKIFIILIMLVYGLSSSGMTITFHYCCNKIDDISFSGPKSKSCKMGNHVEKSSCCNDKQISAKATSDHDIAAKWVQAVNATIAVPVSTPPFIDFVGSIISVERLARGTPLSSSGVPIFLKNRVFRI